MVAGIAVIALCWRLRRPLRLAQTYDAHITEEGLFSALPIYGYLRRYLWAILFAGFVVVLVSTFPVIAVLPDRYPCPDPDAIKMVASLLLAFFGVHMPTITWFETVKRRHRGGYRIQALVDDVGKRLWGVAALLLVSTGLLYFLAVLANG